MLTLASSFRAYVRDVKEYIRLIEREKLLIDPTSIVLLDDFMMKCAAPQARRPSSLGKFFHRYSPEIFDYVEGWTVEQSIPVFNLTFEQLTDARRHLERRAFNAAAHHDELSAIDQVIRNMREGHPDLAVYINYRQHLDDNRPENRFYPAVHVARIVEAANNCHVGGNALETYEARAVLQGYGRDVVQFWQNVRTLKDYSGFFPDKQKVKGNRPDRRMKAWLAGVWVPAFG